MTHQRITRDAPTSLRRATTPRDRSGATFARSTLIVLLVASTLLFLTSLTFLTSTRAQNGSDDPYTGLTPAGGDGSDPRGGGSGVGVGNGNTDGTYDPIGSLAGGPNTPTSFGDDMPGNAPPGNVTYLPNQCQFITKWSGPRCPADYECISDPLARQVAGTFHLTYNQEQCVFCAATNYCTAAQKDACKTLRIITETTTIATINQTQGVGTCYRCKEGQYCPAASNNPFGLAIVNMCSQGYYCPSPAVIRDCPQGYYCPFGTKFPFGCTITGTFCGARSTSPTSMCPGGSYCPDPQTQIRCPEGYFCKAGSIQPKKCPALASCPSGSAAALLFWQGIIFVVLIYIALALVYFSVKLIQHRRRMKEAAAAKRKADGQEVVQLLKSLKTFQHIERQHAALTPRHSKGADTALMTPYSAMDSQTRAMRAVVAAAAATGVLSAAKGAKQGGTKEQQQRSPSPSKSPFLSPYVVGQDAANVKSIAGEQDNDPYAIVAKTGVNPSAVPDGDMLSRANHDDATVAAGLAAMARVEHERAEDGRDLSNVKRHEHDAAIVRPLASPHETRTGVARADSPPQLQPSPHSQQVEASSQPSKQQVRAADVAKVEEHLRHLPSRINIDGEDIQTATLAAALSRAAEQQNAATVSTDSDSDSESSNEVDQDGDESESSDNDDELTGFDQVPCPISLEFDKLGLKLKNGTEILNGVSGEFEAGRLIALMGPSGAGKSTFLNVLCGKATYGKQTGTVRINDVETSIKNVKSVMGFVPQDDVMHDDLTCYENLYYNAMLRLPRSMAWEQKNQIIDDTIRMLDLQAIQHSVVGSVEKRGISGGQRKRVNIGMEVVAWPYILFMDEPTSGLDSCAASQVLTSLRDLTDLGMSCIMVIHQPRFSIVELFHEMLLLGKGGQTVFLGNSTQALSYFLDLGFALPANENPADFFLDVISGEVRRDGDPDFQPSDLFDLWEEMGEWVRRGEMEPPRDGSDQQPSGSDEDQNAPEMSASQRRDVYTNGLVSPLWRSPMSLNHGSAPTGQRASRFAPLNVTTPSMHMTQHQFHNYVAQHNAYGGFGGYAATTPRSPFVRLNNLPSTQRSTTFAGDNHTGSTLTLPQAGDLNQRAYTGESYKGGRAMQNNALLSPKLVFLPVPSASDASNGKHRRARTQWNTLSAYRAGVTSAADVPLPKHRELLQKLGRENIGKLVEEYETEKHQPKNHPLHPFHSFHFGHKPNASTSDAPFSTRGVASGARSPSTRTRKRRGEEASATSGASAPLSPRMMTSPNGRNGPPTARGHNGAGVGTTPRTSMKPSASLRRLDMLFDRASARTSTRAANAPNSGLQAPLTSRPVQRTSSMAQLQFPRSARLRTSSNSLGPRGSSAAPNLTVPVASPQQHSQAVIIHSPPDQVEEDDEWERRHENERTPLTPGLPRRYDGDDAHTWQRTASDDDVPHEMFDAVRIDPPPAPATTAVGNAGQARTMASPLGGIDEAENEDSPASAIVVSPPEKKSPGREVRFHPTADAGQQAIELQEINLHDATVGASASAPNDPHVRQEAMLVLPPPSHMRGSSGGSQRLPILPPISSLGESSPSEVMSQRQGVDLARGKLSLMSPQSQLSREAGDNEHELENERRRRPTISTASPSASHNHMRMNLPGGIASPRIANGSGEASNQMASAEKSSNNTRGRNRSRSASKSDAVSLAVGAQKGVVPPARDLPYVHEQFLYLLQRQMLKVMRNINNFVFDMTLTVAVGLAVGLIFGGVWSLNGYATISVMGILCMGVLSCVSALKMFGNDRVIFWREASAGISITGYWLAVTILHLPVTIVFSFLFVAPYWNLILPDAGFLDTWYIFIGVHFACSGGGMLLAVAFSPIPALLCGVMIPLIVGGFLNGVSPALSGSGDVMRFFCDISYARYGVEALMIQQLSVQPDYAGTIVDEVYTDIGFNGAHLQRCIGALFGIGCIMRFLTLIALHTLNRDKRV